MTVRNSVIHYFYSLIGVVFFQLFWTDASFGQSESRQDLPISYSVQSGDTLSIIAKKYLISAEAISDLLQANPEIKPERLNINQTILIPRHLLRYVKTNAVISYLQCDRQVTLENGDKVLSIGSTISQDDVINVPSRCEMNLTFDDKSTVRMPAGGMIKVTTLRLNFLQKLPEIQLDLLDGRLEVKVTKRNPSDGAFEIRTPTSVAGVRGTEFRVGFDGQTGASQVEVSSGVVAARGNEDKNDATIGSQRGLAIKKTGVAGKVEILPKAIPFLTVQAQQYPNWLLLVFGQDPNAQEYLLNQSNSINTSNLEPAKPFTQPHFLAQDLTSKASFLEWRAQTASGLQGDARKFGICLSKTNSKPFRCDVEFDLHGMREAKITLEQITTDSQSKAILNSVSPGKKSIQALVTGLPAGNYRWEINYKVGNNLDVRNSGAFELIAINR